MKNKILTVLIITLAFSFTTTNAGWYECYNFTGTIDKSPITLSLQIMEGYFGENDKKDFNILGVYKYDKNNTPIRLEGKRNLLDNKVVLYEVNGKKQTAMLEFDFSENESSGFWKNILTVEKFPLKLKYLSKILDISREDQFKDVEILQANSLKDFYFVGVYSKIADDQRAGMKELKIVKKKDNSLFQTLNFTKIESQTGNVITIIFDNVDADKKSNNFTVSNNVGRMGGYLNVKYSLKTKKFVLYPKPIIDGPN